MGWVNAALMNVPFTSKRFLAGNEFVAFIDSTCIHSEGLDIMVVNGTMPMPILVSHFRRDILPPSGCSKLLTVKLEFFIAFIFDGGWMVLKLIDMEVEGKSCDQKITLHSKFQISQASEFTKSTYLHAS